MGLLWGLGHGTTLVLIGLPLVLVGRFLPEVSSAGGGGRHRPDHRATGGETAHPVASGTSFTPTRTSTMEMSTATFTRTPTAHHTHTRTRRRAGRRYPLTVIGLVHGIGGSGGLTLLLLSTISDKLEATVALLLFAAGTAVSMALLSTAFGLAISGGPVARNFGRVAPALGVLSMAFGGWYALGALGVVVYPF